MSEIVMPRLSDSMEEGTILKWLKSDGEPVARGEPLAEIETDKATLTYESDAAGVLRIVVAAGETLPIGEVIARLEDGAGGERPSTASQAGDGDSGESTAASQAGDGGSGESTAGAEPATSTPSATEAAAATGGPAAPPAGAAPATPAAGAAAAAPAEAAPPAATDPPASGSTAPPRPETGRVKASPLARRIAREQGVDLRLVTGTGPGGRIVKADVEEAASSGSAPAGTVPENAMPTAAGSASAPASTPSAPASAAAPGAARPAATSATAAAATNPATPGAPTPPAAAVPAETGTAKGDITIVELTRIQQVIARRMAESKATVPEFTLRTEIDMEACVDLRSQLKAIATDSGAPGGDVPSYNDMVVRACALALREFPRANGSYKDGKFELHSRVNVGVAVAATDALVVPTVFDADRKSLREIARESRALAERVRAGTVTPPELSGGTFTVSNLGMYGVTDFTAVINPPQAAILAVGALAPRAVVRDTPSGAQAAELVARNTMAVTLACDHRILYGADAAQFLARIRALLEQPLALAF